MAFLIGGANTLDDAYDISNSLRQYGTDQYLSRSISSTGNERTATVSVWVKRATTGTEHTIFSNKISSAGSNCFKFAFFNDDELSIQIGTTANSNTTLTTNRKFRDPAAWYHLMAVIDTDQATEANRVRIYVNGEEETSFSDSGYPSRNSDMRISNSSFPHTIGEDPRDNTHFHGYLSEMYFIDGTALTPSSFGKTDNNGVWIPKDAKDDLTFGTNGFYMEFKETGTGQNSSSIGADTSGNDNHFQPTNHSSLHIMPDTPTNNFCTLNYIARDPHATLSAANLKWTSGGNGGVVGTMAVSNGKWYWECKGVDVGADSQLGIWQTSKDTGYPLNQYVGTGESWGYVTFSGKNIHSDSQSGAITTVSDNDIMMFALDMDNYKLWFGINGTWTQSGNPATGANANHTGITDEFMTPAIASFSGSSGYDWRFNFGGPNFTISSGNADANGYGNFEYAPPSGFYALCTKNLAEYG